MDRPLMPKATAVWLVDNTSLTFDQIATFTGLHPLEVKGIADGDVAVGILGLDPLAGGQLDQSEIDAGLADPEYKLKLKKSRGPAPRKRSKGPSYTPIAKRQDKPDAIAWIVRYHPYVKDSQIVKLIGTTKNTIQAIRDRTHWNIANLNPRDPVLLGLCSQSHLDSAIEKAAESIPKPEEEESDEEALATLMPESSGVGASDGLIGTDSSLSEESREDTA